MEELEHRLKLNQQRAKEFELLNFSINSARVFFITNESPQQPDSTAEESAQEQPEASADVQEMLP